MTYSLIFLILIPIFGLNFIVSFICNIILLIFLIPILILLVGFLSINAFKLKFKKCEECGATNIGNVENCFYCGASLDNSFENQSAYIDASKKTIEVEAEEIK